MHMSQFLLHPCLFNIQTLLGGSERADPVSVILFDGCCHATIYCIYQLMHWQNCARQITTIYSRLSLSLCLFHVEKGRFFRFRLPAPLSMLGVSKQSLPQEDPDVVTIHSADQNDKRSSCSSSLSLSLSPRELHPPTGESCSPSYGNDTRALIGHLESCSPVSGPQDHSSPRGPWERPDPQEPVGVVSRRTSRASMCTFRRASSTQDLEGLGTHAQRTYRDRHASEGTRVES